MQGNSPFTQAERKSFGDFISPMFQNTFTPRMQGSCFSRHEILAAKSVLYGVSAPGCECHPDG